jgi:hypothetical protein
LKAPLQTSGLFDDPARVFIIAQRHKLRMPQVIRSGPFQKIDPCDRLRLEPDAAMSAAFDRWQPEEWKGTQMKSNLEVAYLKPKQTKC